MKKFSVITVNFNNKEGLRKTIDSVLQQTYRDFEFILIDGGSTDGSLEIIQQAEQHIDYWVSESDRGIYHAMNKGILEASGTYCIFMNSGDYFHHATVLEEVSPQCDRDIITGQMIKGTGPFPTGYPSHDISMLHFAKSTIPHQATFIRKELFQHSLYDENYQIVSDWKFFIEVLVIKNCSFRKIDTVIAHVDDGGISRQQEGLLRMEREKVIKELLPERICVDYAYFTGADSPLLQITPLFNKTYGFQKFIYSLVLILTKIYIFSRKVLFRQTHPKAT